MQDVIAIITVVVFLILTVGWLFFSDKIVRFLGLIRDEDNSWIFPNKE